MVALRFHLIPVLGPKVLLVLSISGNIHHNPGAQSPASPKGGAHALQDLLCRCGAGARMPQHLRIHVRVLGHRTRNPAVHAAFRHRRTHPHGGCLPRHLSPQPRGDGSVPSAERPQLDRRVDGTGLRMVRVRQLVPGASRNRPLVGLQTVRRQH